MVGAVSTLGVSVAVGMMEALERQAQFTVNRDGQRGLEPEGAVGQQDGGPRRASTVISTAYGPLTRTTFVGRPGTRLPVPGITAIGPDGSIMASPAVLTQMENDWSGELHALIGAQHVSRLGADALASPNEFVLVEFLAAAPADREAQFGPVTLGGHPEPVDGSLVLMGLAVLLFPSLGLSISGGRLHLSHRASRYGLLRTLGMTQSKMAALILVEMATPLLLGAVLGTLAYRGTLAFVPAIHVADASYWASDLLLAPQTAATVVLSVVIFGMVASVRVVRAACADPFAVLRHPRRDPRRWLAAGVVLGGVLVVAAARSRSAASNWLMPLGVLASVFGLIGLTRLAVSGAGGAVLRTRFGQISGSRMLRSPVDAMLGTTAAAVAVLLVAFVDSANFSPGPADVGAFDVVAELPNVQSADELVAPLRSINGVERVHDVGRSVARVNGEEMSLYTASCDDLRLIARLSGPCGDRQLFLGKSVPMAAVGEVVQEGPDASVGIDGRYAVRGRVQALWMGSDEAVLASSEGESQHTLLVIGTDGSATSLRALFLALGDRSEVETLTTRDAIAAGPDIDEMVTEPYLATMVSAAGVVAAFALAFAAMSLLRQRRREFEMARCLGVTATALTVDIVVLFSVPLLVALGLAFCLGIGLAALYNVSVGAPFEGLAGLVPVMTSVVISGSAASLWVMNRARRVSAVIPDPDALT